MENQQQAQAPQAQEPIGFNFDVIKQNIVYLVEKSYSCKAFKMDEVPAVIELKNTLLFFADEKKRLDEVTNAMSSIIATQEATIAELNERIAQLENPQAPAPMEVVKDEDGTANAPVAKKAKKSKDVNDIDVKDPQFESNHVDK